jgi:hypothetical protein
MFANSFDGFGGLTSKYVGYLSEEFSKRPIIAYLSFPYFDEQVCFVLFKGIFFTSFNYLNKGC